MAERWVHGAFNLLALYRSRLDRHIWKDEPYKKYGTRHRKYRHPYYEGFKKKGPAFFDELKKEHDFRKIGHEKADLEHANATHDWLDYLYDNWPPEYRKLVELYLIDILENPESLKRKGIDIREGKGLTVVDYGGKEEKYWLKIGGMKEDYEKIKRIYYKCPIYELYKSYKFIKLPLKFTS